MLDLLAGFIQELRAAGLPVSLTENLDAMEAVGHIPIEDREAFKYALGATLVKNHAHWKTFETVFEVYFALRGAEFGIDADDDASGNGQVGERQEGMPQAGGGGGVEALTPEQLAEMLYPALANADEAMMPALPRQAAPRGRRLHARPQRGDGRPAPRHPAPGAQARGAPGAEAAARPQGATRLPQHGAPLTLVRRGARRAEVPLPASGEARDHRG